MSVGGRIIEVRDVAIPVGGLHATLTIAKRLWCVDPDGRETCVHAEWYPPSEGPEIGDAIWWQAGRIVAIRTGKTLRKIGCSFASPGDQWA